VCVATFLFQFADGLDCVCNQVCSSFSVCRWILCVCTLIDVCVFQCLLVLDRLDVWLSGGNELCVWNRDFELQCKTVHHSDEGIHTHS